CFVGAVVPAALGRVASPSGVAASITSGEEIRRQPDAKRPNQDAAARSPHPVCGASPLLTPPEAKPQHVEVPGPIEITVLRVGHAPYTWGAPDAGKGRRALLSFVTEDVHTCEVMAWARVRGRPEANPTIRWQIQPPAGFSLAEEPRPGAQLRATLTRA